MRWPSASSLSSTTPVRTPVFASPARGPEPWPGSEPGPESGASGGIGLDFPVRPVARRRMIQFAAAADSAAVTPISRMATRPTWNPDGPTAARRPLPSEPPENAAARPASTPAALPAANPHSGAASITGVGAIRTVTTPANTPARYGIASTSTGSQAGPPGWAPDGSAASIGKAGTAPRTVPVGATTVPAPNANPGPSV